ncbi:outer membrane efflux protein [Anaeromyxobacter dehalogenans 2CP-1]|uniref:Outer membrane efflux protein n=1 Tax=Anaeromyxobacter dehalogenans (strain ATCC BAA-258 / DSM 21875 / 2CP-1) TaxID=455488 RepID=B8JB02_ANAD2|nr:TolC family protein [Anaeromyxobacter dehalogenans]ACL63813.1 outer membrane efflux protein [Anaeromyxobacter dehalogenans 2CP-1]
MNALITAALALALAQTPGTPSTPAPAPATPPAPDAAPVAAPAPVALPVLTLDDALAAAAAQNLDLKAAQARLRQADELSWKAWSGYLPQVTASGTYTRNETEAVLPAGSLGPGSPKITIQAQDQLNGLVEATQALLAPQLLFAIPNASRAEEIARLNVETARREVLFGVAQAYYGAASLRRAMEVSERLLEIAARQEKDARVRYQAGAIAKVGLLRAEIDRARAEQDVKRSQNAFASARIALATLLDRRPDFDVVDPPEPVLAGDADALVAAALRDRPDVQAARLNVELQRGARNQAVARYLPNLGAFGRYTLANEAGFTGTNHAWAAGLALQWKVLDGGLRESDIREANAKIDEANASSGSAELKARQEVEQAYLDLESARANAAKAKEQRDLAAENQRLVDVAFRAGTATAVEQADATAQLRTAEVGQITESLTAQLAALRVLKAAGAFHPTRR